MQRREDKCCVGLKGLLPDRRGGGGASPAGKPAKVPEERWRGVTKNSDRQDGMAGGGAGYLGGSAGERIVHHHTNECYRDASYTPAFGNWQHFVYANDSYSNTYTATSVGGHTTDDNNTYHVIRAGWSRPYWAADGWNTRDIRGLIKEEIHLILYFLWYQSPDIRWYSIHLRPNEAGTSLL